MLHADSLGGPHIEKDLSQQFDVCRIGEYTVSLVRDLGEEVRSSFFFRSSVLHYFSWERCG